MPPAGSVAPNTHASLASHRLADQLLHVVRAHVQSCHARHWPLTLRRARAAAMLRVQHIVDATGAHGVHTWCLQIAPALH